MRILETTGRKVDDVVSFIHCCKSDHNSCSLETSPQPEVKLTPDLNSHSTLRCLRRKEAKKSAAQEKVQQGFVILGGLLHKTYAFQHSQPQGIKHLMYDVMRKWFLYFLVISVFFQWLISQFLSRTASKIEFKTHWVAGGAPDQTRSIGLACSQDPREPSKNKSTSAFLLCFDGTCGHS